MSVGPPWKGDVGPDFILDRVWSSPISPGGLGHASLCCIFKGEESTSFLFHIGNGCRHVPALQIRVGSRKRWYGNPLLSLLGQRSLWCSDDKEMEVSAGPPWKGDMGPDFILDRVCSGQISPWERHVVSFHSILKGEKSFQSWWFPVSLRK